jgi:putative membrane protein
MIFFSDSDQARIADTIAGVERKTSAEIVAVVAADSGSYLHVPFLWAALAALLVPWPLIYFTWWPVQWIFIVQLAVFAALVLALMPRSVRLALVPRSVRHDRAHRRAACRPAGDAAARAPHPPPLAACQVAAVARSTTADAVRSRGC